MSAKAQKGEGMKNNNDVVIDVLAGIGAAAIGAVSCWAGHKLYDRFKKKYATLEVAERGKEDEEP